MQTLPDATISMASISTIRLPWEPVTNRSLTVGRSAFGQPHLSQSHVSDPVTHSHVT